LRFYFKAASAAEAKAKKHTFSLSLSISSFFPFSLREKERETRPHGVDPAKPEPHSCHGEHVPDQTLLPHGIPSERKPGHSTFRGLAACLGFLVGACGMPQPSPRQRASKNPAVWKQTPSLWKACFREGGPKDPSLIWQGWLPRSFRKASARASAKSASEKQRM